MTAVLQEGTHLSDPQALSAPSLQWDQRGPGVLGTLEDLEDRAYQQALEGQCPDGLPL